MLIMYGWNYINKDQKSLHRIQRLLYEIEKIKMNDSFYIRVSFILLVYAKYFLELRLEQLNAKEVLFMFFRHMLYSLFY